MPSSLFSRYLRQLRPALQALLGSSECRIGAGLPRDVPKEGVYLFSEGGRHLYVGRSDSIRRRMGLHTRPSAGHNQATFAYRIARRNLGMGKPTYKPTGSREDMLRSAGFNREFEAAKRRIRAMDVRFVRTDDPALQALLEIYAALELRTPYNEFKTT
jgi:hypothetical protein